MIGAIIGVGVTIALALITQAYHLGSRLQSLKDRTKDNSKVITKLNNRIENHLESKIEENKEAINRIEGKLDDNFSNKGGEE